MRYMQAAQASIHALGRRDAWVASRSGWQITHAFGLPGWWEATLNGQQVARYNDLDDLMDRLEASFG